MSASDPRPPLDCFDVDPDLLPLEVAIGRIEAATRALTGTDAAAHGAVEKLHLRAALGRILATDVRSPRDVPAHTNSAMDGYAVAAADLADAGDQTFDIVGTVLAGQTFAGEVESGQTVRIMTGAAMPRGTDTVVMQEVVTIDGDRARIGAGHRSGQNVRAAGEDIRRGAIVLGAGRRLFAAELGMLASLGVAEVALRRRIRVATFSTGDELRSLGEPLAEGAVYDSNRYTLYALLARLDVDVLDLGVVRDSRPAVRAALASAAANADVVISTGGASAGEADYMADTLRELGQVGFWRIAIRPGRPLAFGRIGDALYFGLPGNPVAVMVTFQQVVLPALRAAMGERDPRPTPLLRAVCVSHLRKKPGRVEYYRAVLERDAAGRTVVRHTGSTGSGLLHTMSDANCYIVLGDDAGPVEPGQEVDVQPFYGLY